MRQTTDSKNGARVFLPESIHEMIQIACDTRGSSSNLHDRYFTGRTFDSWEQLREETSKPWREGMELVQQMMDKIKQQVTLTPKDIRRKMRFDEIEGEVDVDRAMRGEYDFYRRPHRQMRVSTRNVALLSNIGNTANYKPAQIFWRGVAATVILDILEEAGYRCELWLYNTAQNAFGYSGYSSWRSRTTLRAASSDSFTAVRVKACEDPINLDLTVNAMSAWFFRIILFSFRASIPGHSVGGCSSQPILDPYIEHIDLTQGIKNVKVCSTAYSEIAAVVAVNEALEEVTAQQGDDKLEIYDR